MPKKYLPLKIIAYDKDCNFYSDLALHYYKYSDAIKVFNQFADLLTAGQFDNITRIDLVSSSRVLFSVVSLREIIDQRNYIINFKPF